MDAAEKLLDELPRWVELQKEGAAKMKDLATEMEERKKNVTVSKVVGSSVSVGGAAALAAAGILTLCTGGLAIPILLGVGAVATGAGIVTNVGADIGDAVESRGTMKEAEEVSEKIQKAEENMKDLVKTLTDEQQKDDQLPADKYVMERILRAMAKRKGLMFSDDVSLSNILPRLSKCHKSEAFSRIRSFILRVLLMFAAKAGAKQAGKTLAIQATRTGAKQLGYYAVSQSIDLGGKEAFKQTGKAAFSVATKVGGTAAKAAGRIAGGAVGLGFSIAELVYNCQDLNNYETEASESLRENAKAIQEAAEELEKQLHDMEKLIERLARVKLAIEAKERSSDEKKDLLEFAIEICEDESVRQWLRKNSAAFFHLTTMFNLVKEHIDKKKGKTDIIFVAHGAIRDEKHKATYLRPLPTITDVLLYSPWNCAINAKAAYGIATGCIQPLDRQFLCGCEDKCGEDHHPRKLPPNWNSMKKAGIQRIPKIMVQSLKQPKDRAWEAYIDLTAAYGQPGRSRIVIPFLNPIPFSRAPLTVPFYVVTLALSLALYFSKYEATVHLAACLDDRSKVKFDKDFLECQYSYTIDDSGMTCPVYKFPAQDPELQRLYTALQDVFDTRRV